MARCFQFMEISDQLQEFRDWVCGLQHVFTAAVELTMKVSMPTKATAEFRDKWHNGNDIRLQTLVWFGYSQSH